MADWLPDGTLSRRERDALYAELAKAIRASGGSLFYELISVARDVARTAPRHEARRVLLLAPTAGLVEFGRN